MYKFTVDITCVQWSKISFISTTVLPKVVKLYSKPVSLYI